MADRHWVGGSGTWNTTNTANWSDQAGGSSGFSVPTASDSVFFDQAGTYTVTMTGALTCLDFNVSAGTVTFATGTTPTLAISGNMAINSVTPTWTSTGLITFNATSAKTIKSNGVTFSCGFTFDGVGGSWQLQTAVTTTNTVTLTNGTLDLNNFVLAADTFNSSNSNVRRIVFGTGTINITRTTGGNPLTLTTGTNMSWDTATGTGTFVMTNTGAGNPTPLFPISGDTAQEANTFSLVVLAGSGTVSLSNAVNIRNLDFGQGTFTGTFGNSVGSCNIWGNLTLNASMAGGPPATTNTITFRSTSATTRTITTAGKTFDCPITFNGAGGSWSLPGNFTIGSSRTMTLTAGTLSMNGNAVSVGSFAVTGASAKVLAFGTGGTLTVQAAGATAFNNTSTAGTLTTSGSGTINMTAATAKTFVGGGRTYAATLNQGGAGALTVTGANTFNDITATTTPSTVTLPSSTTTTVSSFTLSGTAGNLVTLQSSTAGTRATLSKTSGSVLVSYLSIKDNAATGGASWVSQLGTDAGNNTGWTFYSGTAPLSVPVTGASATGIVGTILFPQPIAFDVTGVFATGFVGDASISGAASTALTGLTATAYLDTITVTAGANIALTGLSATGSLGTVTTAGNALVSPTGVEGLALPGTLSVRAAANVTLSSVVGAGFVGSVTTRSAYYLTGVSALGATGSPIVKGGANLQLTGVQGLGQVTSVLVWGMIDDNQNANWTPVNDSDAVLWTQIPT